MSYIQNKKGRQIMACNYDQLTKIQEEVSNMKLMDFMEMMEQLEIETNKSIDHGFISQIVQRFEEALLEKKFGNE